MTYISLYYDNMAICTSLYYDVDKKTIQRNTNYTRKYI
jgi:hypothetical protein